MTEATHHQINRNRQHKNPSQIHIRRDCPYAEKYDTPSILTGRKCVLDGTICFHWNNACTQSCPTLKAVRSENEFQDAKGIR